MSLDKLLRSSLTELFRTKGAGLAMLFGLSLVASLISLVMFWHAALTRYWQVPYDLSVVLCTLVGFYTLPKELGRRANGGHHGGRPGEIIAAAWVLSLIAMAGLEYLSQGAYVIPAHMRSTTLVLFGIFGVSTTSRYLHQKSKSEDSAPAVS